MMNFCLKEFYSPLCNHVKQVFPMFTAKENLEEKRNCSEYREGYLPNPKYATQDSPYYTVHADNERYVVHVERFDNCFILNAPLLIECLVFNPGILPHFNRYIKEMVEETFEHAQAAGISLFKAEDESIRTLEVLLTVALGRALGTLSEDVRHTLMRSKSDLIKGDQKVCLHFQDKEDEPEWLLLDVVTNFDYNLGYNHTFTDFETTHSPACLVRLEQAEYLMKDVLTGSLKTIRLRSLEGGSGDEYDSRFSLDVSSIEQLDKKKEINSQVFLILTGNAFVGFLSLSWGAQRLMGTTPDTVCITGISVFKPYRCRGLAYAAACLGLDWADKNMGWIMKACARVAVQNTPSIALHTRLGFTESSRSVRAQGHTLDMTKDLA